MQTKPENRRAERFNRERIIKLEDHLTLSPYYAVSYNLSSAGMYFKSQFELFPGAHVLIRIDDYTQCHNYVLGKVVWCRTIENNSLFRFDVGVEFIQPTKSHSLEVSPHGHPMQGGS